MPATVSSSFIPTNPAPRSFGGINVGKVGSNLSIVGTADLLGNGSTQMVMEQNNGNYLAVHLPTLDQLAQRRAGGSDRQ